MKSMRLTLAALVLTTLALALPARADWTLSSDKTTITDGTSTLKVSVSGTNISIASNQDDTNYNTAAVGDVDLSQPIKDGDDVTYTLTELKDYSFHGRLAMTSIVLPDTVTAIGAQAFNGCSNLTGAITIPSGVTKIGAQAFNGCRKLAGTITIPSSVMRIGTKDDNTGAFNSVGIDGAGVTVVLSEGLTLIGKNCFKGANLSGTITIPSTVTNIYDCAFYNCSNLTSLVFTDANDPNAAMTIGAQAFYGCRKLAGTITIPGSVTKIGTSNDGNGAFRSVGIDGDGVTLVLSEGLASIGKTCFRDAKLLGKVTIPSTVTSIFDYAFYNCSNLTEIEFARAAAASPNVELAAFLNQNTAVTKVTMPTNLKSVAANAFKSKTAKKPSTFDVYWRNYPNNDATTALPDLFGGMIPSAITFYIPWQDATWATFFSNQSVTLPAAHDGSVVWNPGWSGSPAITVKYWHDPFTLTWNMNGGLLNGNGNDVVESKPFGPFGEVPVTPGNPEKENKVFVGWNTDSAALEPLDLASVIVLSDMTLYAIFVDARVSWYDEDGTSPLSPAVSYLAANAQPTHGDPALTATLHRRHNSFLGWMRADVEDETVYATADLPAVTAGQDISYKAVYNVEDSSDPKPEWIAPDGFAKGVVFTVDEYAKTEDRATLTNFPVLVRISTGISGFNYTDSLVSEGGDIRFADANGDPLPFEKDTWRGENDVSLFWVTLPRMTNGTEFAMFYGASHNEANAFANPFDTSNNPWNEYTGVWHMGDSGDGSGKTIADSTTNALAGTTGASTSKALTDGAIGGARKITTTTNAKNKEQISVSLSDAAKKAEVDALVPQFSVSLWYRRTSSTETDLQWDYLIGRRPKDSTADSGWAIQMDDPSNSGTKNQSLRIWSKEGAENCGCDRPLGFKNLYTVSQTWIKLDVIYDNATYSLYTNGVLLQSSELKGSASNGKTTFLGIGGGAPSGNDIRPFTGDMDEVRLRRGTVSVDWVAADYATQTSASFLSVGTVENVGASTKPIAEFTILDTGAAFIQFSGKVNLLGEGATACALYYKSWKDSESEPAGWTSFATGVGLGAAITNFVVGLDPLTDYHISFKASNNLATPEDSDIQTEPITTSGVGDAGESGGASERQLDEFVHTFTVTDRGVSEFTFTPPTGVTSVEALVVAGGGAGGYDHGGGGGGGGLVYNDALTVVPGQTYTINVGTGGLASASASVYGGNGGDSSIKQGNTVLLSATGGGAGGNGGSNTAGKTGGSGGGSSANVTAGNGTAGQGYAGAKGNGNQAGGGGGAAEAGIEPAKGGTGVFTSGGGGNGLPFEISGENIYYAGGGSGGGVKSFSNPNYGTAGGGGLGGGGKGGQEEATTDTATAEDGVDGLGGGGGGGSAVANYMKGGNGGNGVVIIRYGAGGDGNGVVHPTISLTGLDGYSHETGKATVTYRVGWAGDGYDNVNVSLIYGYDADKLVYTNANIATDAIGQGSVLVDLPRVSKTVYVRLLATNSGNYCGTSPEIKSLVLFNPAAPVGEMVSATPRFTRASFVVRVTDLGTQNKAVSGAFQVCPDRFFDEGNYTTYPIDGSCSEANGTLSGFATGLAPNSGYWVRAALTNDVPATFETAPISFTTEPAGIIFLVN